MTTGAKIAKLRKEHNYTQEQLAALLGVSRQAISKWESDGAWPETDKLIRLSELFGCTVDYLLKENVEDPGSTAPAAPVFTRNTAFIGGLPFGYEYVSKKKIFGMPLVHITWSHRKVSKGFFALGLRAKGVISLGLLPVGVLSFGILPVGILSFGTFAIGLLAFGAFAFGLLFAGGAITVGSLALGAVANGLFANGALANGWFAAFGDEAYSHGVAIAQSWAEGAISLFQQPRIPGEAKLFSDPSGLVYTLAEAKDAVLQNTPAWLHWLAHIFNLTY